MTQSNQSTNSTSNENQNRTDRQGRRSRHGFWMGITAGGLLGLIVGGVAAVGATALAAPRLASAVLHPGHRSGEGFRDPELARERAEFATEWMFDKVDASDDQKAQARAIVSHAVDDLVPLVQEHRQGREALVAELTKAEIDPAAIERIRVTQMELVDRASKDLVGTLAELADVLSPEQRTELLEMAKRLHN